MRFKNVFVLSAGRTATTTFIEASKHLPGITASHESRVADPIQNRLDYPNNHIEADNRLIFFLSLLDEKFATDTAYVYLLRDEKLVARSYSERWHLSISIVRAFTNGVRMVPRVKNNEILDYCHDYVKYVDSVVRLHLSKQENAFVFDLSKAEEEYKRFAKWVGVENLPEAACAEWRQHHNLNRYPKVSTWIKRRIRILIN